MRALQGVPETTDVERATLDWAVCLARASEEVLVAFKLDDSHFKVIRSQVNNSEEGVFDARATR